MHAQIHKLHQILVMMVTMILKNYMKEANTYEMVMLVMMTVLVTYMVPRFAQLYAQLASNIPYSACTQALLASRIFLTRKVPALLLSLRSNSLIESHRRLGVNLGR